MEATLDSEPGTKFEYSDINYIVLGALVEKLSGEELDDYAREYIFGPLGMKMTDYHPFYCGPYMAVYRPPQGTGPAGIASPKDCTLADWYYPILQRVAPTEHDAEGTKGTNPNFDALLRGVVEDPTTRRMGGVAGEAGVFSTAGDVALFAQALLDRLAGRPSDFPLEAGDAEVDDEPEQPATAVSGATIFAADGKTTTGVAVRGFGWDINSAFSRPRGEVFPIGSFGHTGFTGTSLWMDPASDTAVVLLSNAIHPRVGGAISALRGQVATATAKVLQLELPSTASAAAASVSSDAEATSNGIDVLEASKFAVLREVAARHDHHLRVGLLTNQTGLDRGGRRTIDVINRSIPEVELKTLFTPEHGLFGNKDSVKIGKEADPATGLPVVSLYGAKEEQRRPSAEALKNLDAVIIDLQDAGGAVLHL
jgi:CubicO group peptidase (beta-lactamase class C family)